MHTLFSNQVIPYLGTNLRSGWIAETFGLRSEALVAWLGPCHVITEHLVDLEDVAAGAEIHAELMLHFLAEHPGDDLLVTVCRQRLLVAEALEVLRELAPSRRYRPVRRRPLQRRPQALRLHRHALAGLRGSSTSP